MKKLLSLFFVAALSVSAWADYTMVAVTDFEAEYDSYYQYYTLSFGSEEGSSNHYKYDISFMIYPETESFVGTFTTEGANPTLEKNNSKLNWVEGTKVKASRYLNKATGSSNITIAKVAGKSFTYTMSGTLRARKASGETSDKVYNFNNIEFTCDPYKDEPAKTSLTLNSSNIKLYDYTSTQGYTRVDILNSSNYEMALAFMGSTYGLPAGTYNVASTKADGTIMASPGMDGYYPELSYYTPSYGNNYFIVDGSLTVSYSADNKQVTIAGTLTTGHESTITVSATAANPFYVDPVYTREDLTIGNFGTICLSRKILGMTGTDGLYVPAYKDNNILYCDEVPLDSVKAGRGYIFKAAATTATFTINPEEAETDPVEENYMYGWLADDQVLSYLDLYYDFDGYALLAGNQIITPSAGSTIKQNRAFINLADVPTEPTQAPERGRRISFGTNTTTGVVDVNASRMSDVHKFVNNGQLIIIRNGVKFNAMGQEL